MFLTDTPPIRCASCMDQRTELKHVDFESAYDGPVIPGSELLGPVTVDHLVICEACIRRAGEMVGMVDPGDSADVLAATRAELDQTKALLFEHATYSKQLEAAVAAKPKAPAKRPVKEPIAKAAA